MVKINYSELETLINDMHAHFLREGGDSLTSIYSTFIEPCLDEDGLSLKVSLDIHVYDDDGYEQAFSSYSFNLIKNDFEGILEDFKGSKELRYILDAAKEING